MKTTVDVPDGVIRESVKYTLAVPAMDLLLAACAFHQGVEIESSDKHFLPLGKFR